MMNIFVISKRLLSIILLVFTVFLVLSSVSAKPAHASIVGGSGGQSSNYWECTNVPANGDNCNSNIPVTDGSVGINVTAYDYASNGTVSKYNTVGITIRSTPPSGFGGDSTSYGGWGPYWNYWFQGSGCESGYRCWDFANGNYSINQGIENNYQYPTYPRPGVQNGPGAAPSKYYSASGSTNSNGVYYLSSNGYLDCGFSPFTLSISPPSSYNSVSITETNGQGLSSNSISLGNLIFSNGITYNFIVKIYTNASTSPTGCSITVSASTTNPASGSYTIFTIHETYNGSNVSGDTLKITSNDGTPTKTNPTTNSLGISNPTEYDPGSSPNTVIFTVASGRYSNCSGQITIKWGGGGSSSTCSIIVSASPSNPTVGGDTTLGITEKLNGVLAPNGDTLDISSNTGSVSTSSVVYSGSPTNVSEGDPSSVPNTPITFTVKSTKYANCSGSTTVTWSGLLCTSGGSAPGCEPPVQPVCVGGTNGSYGGANSTTLRNYKQLVINGSLIGYNGIYDYRDLGGCDPYYPAVKILYNLKYISLYNVNFLKLIGNNLEIWQEEGI